MARKLRSLFDALRSCNVDVRRVEQRCCCCYYVRCFGLRPPHRLLVEGQLRRWDFRSLWTMRIGVASFRLR